MIDMVDGEFSRCNVLVFIYLFIYLFIYSFFHDRCVALLREVIGRPHDLLKWQFELISRDVDFESFRLAKPKKELPNISLYTFLSVLGSEM